METRTFRCGACGLVHDLQLAIVGRLAALAGSALFGPRLMDAQPWWLKLLFIGASFGVGQLLDRYAFAPLCRSCGRSLRPVS